MFIINLFTASGDVFFIFHVAGATVRYAQAALILGIGLFLATRLNGEKIRLAPGIEYLTVFSALCFAFTPNSPYLKYAYSNQINLVIFALAVFCYSDIYSRSLETLTSIIKWYIISFSLVAAFGLVQFAAGLIGVTILTKQWVIYHRFPRINGFGYEPSYFGIYLSCGWGVLAILVDRGIHILSKRIQIFSLALITIALILSTSRSAIFAIFCGTLILCGRWVYRGFRGVKINFPRKFIIFSVVTAPTAFLAWILSTRLLTFMFLGGLGIEGTPDHSVFDRTRAMAETITVFLHNPIIGVGIGGIAPTIAQMYSPGLSYDLFMASKATGANVFLEMLAAGGIFGGAAAFLYFIKLFEFIFWNRKNYDQTIYNITLALGFGFLIQLALLVGSQNILRVYVWNHIAILSAALILLKRHGVVTAQAPTVRGVSAPSPVPGGATE